VNHKIVLVPLIGSALVLGAGADASPPSYAPAPSLHKARLIPLAPLDSPKIYRIPLTHLDSPGQRLDS
jgi:hypothetical protein